MKTKAAFAGLILSACAHSACSSEKPAVLALDPHDDLSRLAATLSDVEGRAELTFGPPDPRVQPVVTVLPPRPTRFETRSPALPSTYDIVMRGDQCVLRRRTDEVEVALPADLPCTPFTP